MNEKVVEALKPQIDMIPGEAIITLKRLAELTGHDVNACIAGWWIRFGEVQTLHIELDWRDKMIETKETERKEWADMCIKKQSIIEKLSALAGGSDAVELEKENERLKRLLSEQIAINSQFNLDKQ